MSNPAKKLKGKKPRYLKSHKPKKVKEDDTMTLKTEPVVEAVKEETKTIINPLLRESPRPIPKNPPKPIKTVGIRRAVGITEDSEPVKFNLEQLASVIPPMPEGGFPIFLEEDTGETNDEKVARVIRESKEKNQSLVERLKKSSEEVLIDEDDDADYEEYKKISDKVNPEGKTQFTNVVDSKSDDLIKERMNEFSSKSKEEKEVLVDNFYHSQPLQVRQDDGSIKLVAESDLTDDERAKVVVQTVVQNEAQKRLLDRGLKSDFASKLSKKKGE